MKIEPDVIAWDKLKNELDNWEKQDRVATFWWRDDDAADITPELLELIHLSTDLMIPLVIAAIPFALSNDFRAYCFPHSVKLAQHGYAHINHANFLSKKSEFCKARSVKLRAMDIKNGFSSIMELKQSIKIFVPPWNRIDNELLPILQKIGFHSISTFAARLTPEPVKGLKQINTHVDLIDWNGNKAFVGDRIAINYIVEHLKNKRLGYIDPTEPTGLLTHHLLHQSTCWSFLEKLFIEINAHPSANWLEIENDAK